MMVLFWQEDASFMTAMFTVRAVAVTTHTRTHSIYVFQRRPFMYHDCHVHAVSVPLQPSCPPPVCHLYYTYIPLYSSPCIDFTTIYFLLYSVLCLSMWG